VDPAWDMGSSDKAKSKAQYSDSPTTDANATTSNALAQNYQGLSTDVDGDGKPDFIRYWNVYEVDVSGTGTPNGKLVQIITRWKDPNVGWRQIAITTFRRNPASLF
jgi:hypothetical protein